MAAAFRDVSPDGKWLYYTIGSRWLWKMPTEGGEATRVLPRLSPFGLAVGPGGVYVTDLWQVDGFPIVFLPFDGGQQRTVLMTPAVTYLIPDVSPDERWLLYTLADDPVREVREIMLVDNFR